MSRKRSWTIQEVLDFATVLLGFQNFHHHPDRLSSLQKKKFINPTFGNYKKSGNFEHVPIHWKLHEISEIHWSVKPIYLFSVFKYYFKTNSCSMVNGQKVFSPLPWENVHLYFPNSINTKIPKWQNSCFLKCLLSFFFIIWCIK